VLKGYVNGEEIKEAVTPAPVGPTLKDEFPEVEAATRLRNMGSPKITYQNITYRNSKFAFVDPNFFEVFTLPLLQGDPKTALREPNSIEITQEQSLKYIGDENPHNKILE
jgi:putative ABC transport system permease protein